MDLGCIFNWDGAVVSSIDKHLEAWSLLAEETKQTLPNEFIEEAFGKNPLWILSNLLQWTDKNDDIFHLRNRREAIYREIIRKLRTGWKIVGLYQSKLSEHFQLSGMTPQHDGRTWSQPLCMERGPAKAYASTSSVPSLSLKCVMTDDPELPFWKQLLSEGSL